MIVKIVESIIKPEDLISPEEFLREQLNNNLEGVLKERFINIIKRNTNENNVIKLIDLKNNYHFLLDKIIKDNPKTEQIFKNLTSSNKDNNTHLLRNQNINWYYLHPSNEKNGTIEAKFEDLKPLPLPPKLERSRRKRYYIFYSSEIHDSAFSTIEEIIIDSPEAETRGFEDVDFEDIKTSKVDFIEKQKLSEKVGLIGEEYVLDYEKNRLRNLGINKEPIWISERNDKYGFDILSFEKKDGEIINKYIEVKSTTGGLYSNFYISENEVKTSIENADNYYLYRVYGVGDTKTIDHKEFKGSVIDHPKLQNVRIDKTYIYKVIR